MDALPTSVIVLALIGSISLVAFRRLFAWRQARRDKFLWGLDDDKKTVASLYAILGAIGAVVSALLLVLKLAAK